MATSVIQSGNYLLEIDTGWDSGSFQLDDLSKGVLDNPDYLLGPGTTYADVTEGVLNVRIFRGRKDIGDQFTPGTMSFVLNDSNAYGAFNPFNQDSPTYDPANNQPGIAPLRRVRFYRLDSSNNAESLFQGFIVDFTYDFGLDGQDTVAINCVDDQYLLSQSILDEWNVDEELSSVRVVNMLARPEVDAFQGVGQQSIETGVATLGGASAYTVSQGTIAQAYLQDILDAEQGRAFVDRSGVFTYQARIGATFTNPSVSFSDNNGLTVPYSAVSINFGADKVVNRATVTTLQDPNQPQTADDAASQAQYFIQAESIGDSLLHSTTAALDLANYLLVPQPQAIFTQVEAQFQSLTAGQRDAVAILDIGETVSIEKTIQTSITTTDVIAQESAIEGIEHLISYSLPHRVIIYTSPTDVLQEFILDSSHLDDIYALS
jgi:hypothetical protein